MYAVIFEVQPKPGRRQEYLDLAAALRPELEKIDGFLSIERFQSLTSEGKILSLSFWRDAAAVTRWICAIIDLVSRSIFLAAASLPVLTASTPLPAACPS